MVFLTTSWACWALKIEFSMCQFKKKSEKQSGKLKIGTQEVQSRKFILLRTSWGTSYQRISKFNWRSWYSVGSPSRIKYFTNVRLSSSCQLYLECIESYLLICCRGDVVTVECVEKLIKKDWLHPLTGEKLTEKDIIYMQRVSSCLYPLKSCIQISYWCGLWKF